MTHRLGKRRSLARRASVAVLTLGLLTLGSVFAAACGSHATAVQPSDSPTLLSADAGWSAGQGYGFLPGTRHGPLLVGVGGSAARLKWLADTSKQGASLDAADSTLAVTLVDPATGAIAAAVRFRGAGGSGYVDLPLGDAERTSYKVTFRAQGSYRWCELLFETRE